MAIGTIAKSPVLLRACTQQRLVYTFPIARLASSVSWSEVNRLTVQAIQVCEFETFAFLYTFADSPDSCEQGTRHHPDL
jgi:hypothetical protein